MTSHTLAWLLLEGPNLEVYVYAVTPGVTMAAPVEAVEDAMFDFENDCDANDDGMVGWDVGSGERVIRLRG